MLGVTADGVFLYVEAGTTTQMVPMGDCKSFRSYQMLGVTADGVFLYVEEMITTQMMPYGRL